MNCANYRELLAALRPDSQDALLPECAAANAHLDTCPECRHWWTGQQRTDRMLGSAMRTVEVPQDFKARLLAQLNANLNANLLQSGTETSVLTAEIPAAVQDTHPAQPIVTRHPGPRRWSRRHVATVVSALLLVVAFSSGWWLQLAGTIPTVGVNELVQVAHQPVSAQTPEFQNSFQPVFPVNDIRIPLAARTTRGAYSLRHLQQEIGAILPYRVQSLRRHPLSVMLVVINIQQVHIPDLNTIGSSFRQAEVLYPAPDFHATKVWRVGQNLYVCYVISTDPADLDSLRNQQTSA